MTNLKTALELATTLLEQHAKYEAKPTKAESARMRKTLSTIKNTVTEAKRDLMAADQA